MQNHPFFGKVPIVCINLKTRKDRRKHIERLARKKHLGKIHYLTVDPHPKSGARGCLESHITAIKMGMEKRWKNMLILEDDVKLSAPLHKLANPPKDWDMLYLGATVRSILGDDVGKEVKDYSWVRVSCWTTHAYMINLQNLDLVNKIMEALEQEKEIDTFYSEEVHTKFKSYVFNPMIMIQESGYSDIEKREVSYDFMPQTVKGFMKPQHSIKDGNYVLHLSDVNDPLPKVSIITPTYNRRHLFAIALENWRRIEYPRDLLEWIIIDDSTKEYREKYGDLKDIIPQEANVRYYDLCEAEEYHFTIANKRNIGVDLASGQIIVHMDDDDYYPPESVHTRVKVLQKYKSKGIGCVGCSLIGTYDLMTNESGFASDGILSLSEASMGYFKRYWESQKWDNEQERGEYRNFIANRIQTVMDIPYSFCVYGINHNKNLTDRITTEHAKNKETGENVNFIDLWEDETQMLMYDMQSYLKKTETQKFEE
jgi:GR25 family glycosyltransferase involved in LPS biosynthesis